MAVAVTRADNIVSISYFDFLKIHCLSFLWGLWILLKEFLRKVLRKSKDSEQTDQRRKPPECLSGDFGQHLYVKLQYTKLHYVECGSKDKPVVLLLHGFPDCWISWRHQVSTLSKHFRVISLDLKGFGDSDKPSSRSSYRVGVILSELQELIHSLGVSSCNVVGHDLGALIGWYLVHLCPQFVDKFVAISCPHPNFYWTHLPDSNWFNTNWVHYSQLPHLPEKDALKNDLNIINQCYQHLNVKSLKEVAFLDAYKYYFSRKEDWTGAINYYRNLPFCRVSTTEDSVVTVPSLLILGNQDSSVRLESVVRSTEYLSKYQLKIIDSAGHFPHQERPEEVNNLLLSFLVTKPNPVEAEKEIPSGLINRMFGAVSSTVKFGNHVLLRTASSVTPRALMTHS
ncbi:epoxide hydrolase 4-like [Macrosteles quadrilineatus]|uniref:epoxide hydrolase 4-like n=1 Tax=Macrosteles quadrilineatus TaxID=74068 RepID=UPI0023E16ADB|nr:epoxide hydrolase 4-like [Macrosteles quadrilineatus]